MSAFFLHPFRQFFATALDGNGEGNPFRSLERRRDTFSVMRQSERDGVNKPDGLEHLQGSKFDL